MFFFCKQKTAYELRISDWSSDVCSSDLGSIEELAGLLNIEPATLRASIERFNGFVRQNRDDDFHRGERAYDRWLGDWLNKPSETLGCLEQGPFHAVPVVPGDVGTYGRVVTHDPARALRTAGPVLAGARTGVLVGTRVSLRVDPG